jgi:hypothetical protein
MRVHQPVEFGPVEMSCWVRAASDFRRRRERRVGARLRPNPSTMATTPRRIGERCSSGLALPVAFDVNETRPQPQCVDAPFEEA